MKNSGFIILLMCFLMSCTGETTNVDSPIPSKEDAKEAIVKNIEMAAEKWSNGDPMGYVEVAANDITWSDDLAAPIPVSTKEALTEYLGTFKGKVPPHEYELSNFTFQFYEDIVIVTYHYQGTLEEVQMPPWKVTSVYRYAEDNWLSVHENWTKVEIKEETAEDTPVDTSEDME